MTSATYNLLYHNPLGQQIGVFKSIFSLEVARKEREIGVLAVDMHMAESDFSKYLVHNSIVDIQRTKNTKTYLFGQTRYYLKHWEISNDETGRQLVHIEFDDANKILAQRVIGYKAGTAGANKNMAADNMLRAVFSENFVTGTAARSIPTVVSVEPNSTSAPVIRKEFAYRQVPDVLNDICDASEEAGTYLTYDIVPDGELLQFRAYVGQRGTNLGSTSSNPVLVSMDKRNLINPKIVVDYRDAKSYIVAGGQDQGTDRILRASQNSSAIRESPIGLDEGWVDARNAERALDVSNEAKTELNRRTARVLFSGQIRETDSFQLDEQFYFGDMLMVRYAGYTFNCRVNPVHITVDESGIETVDIGLQGEAAI